MSPHRVLNPRKGHGWPRVVNYAECLPGLKLDRREDRTLLFVIVVTDDGTVNNALVRGRHVRGTWSSQAGSSTTAAAERAFLSRCSIASRSSNDNGENHMHVLE